MLAMKEGTLYPILYRLEKDQLVSSRWSEPRGKELSRKYYTITEKGHQLLLELNQLWHEFSNNVSSALEDTYHQIWRNCNESRSIFKLNHEQIKLFKVEKVDAEKESNSDDVSEITDDSEELSNHIQLSIDCGEPWD
jgi:DNA-binding PadR family transcriptional regulator